MAEVTVVGAGLVGSLLSIFLARRGHDVELHERRPDLRKHVISAGRSINLALSTRGIHALKQLGIEKEVLARAIPMYGRVMHSPKGELSFQRYGVDDSQYINSVSRGELNQALLTQAEKTGRVRTRFESRCTHYEPVTGELELNGAKKRVARVIGTDGSASAIRQALAPQGTNELLDYGYKELTLPAAPGGGFQLEKNALHIWPRGNYMLIALPNFDGSFTCTLFLPFTGPTSFARLETPTQVRAFFEQSFADVVALFPGLEEQFFENPTGQMVTVKCAPWHRDGRALLMGDAAHAIVPFFGQGMNCGFEDCTVLDELLERHGENWEQVFSEFSKTRKPNADAIADLAVENFVEMRDKVGQPRFLLMKQVENLLITKFPGRYASRYALVTFNRVPYRLALEAGAVSDAIVGELLMRNGNEIDKPEQVDLVLAERLVEERMAPLLKRGGYGSGT